GRVHPRPAVAAAQKAQLAPRAARPVVLVLRGDEREQAERLAHRGGRGSTLGRLCAHALVLAAHLGPGRTRRAARAPAWPSSGRAIAACMVPSGTEFDWRASRNWSLPDTGPWNASCSLVVRGRMTGPSAPREGGIMHRR